MIVQPPDGTLEHFNWLGYIVMAISLVSVTLMYFVHKSVPEHIRHGRKAAAKRSAETA